MEVIGFTLEIKWLQTAILVIIIILLVPSEAAFAGVPPPPALFIKFTSKSQFAGDRCPALYTATLYPLSDLYGKINLTAVNVPKGAVATFVPNPILMDSSNDSATYMIVTVSPNTPHGNYTLNIKATPLSGSNYNTSYGVAVNGDAQITLNVGSCSEPLNEQFKTNNFTSTLTKEITQTQIQTQTQTIVLTQSSTLTTTAISTERIADFSIYAWAIGATAIAAALAIVLLRKRG